MDSLLLFPVSQGTILTDNTLALIACVNQSAMIVVTYYYFRKVQQRGRKIFYCTLFVVISYLICTLFILLMGIKSFVDLFGCTFLNRGVIVSYYFAKYGVWLYSLVRIELILSSAPGLEYSTQFIRNLHIGIFIVALFCCLLGSTLYEIKQINVNDNFVYCTVSGPYWLPFIQGPPAECVSLFCCYLFYTKMKILFNNLSNLFKKTPSGDVSNGTDNSKEDVSIEHEHDKIECAYIMRKYTILSISSVVSTYICLFALFTPFIWGLLAIDCIVNTVCLILFHKRFDNVYRCLFKCIANTHVFEKVQKELTLSRNINSTELPEIKTESK
eukprot:452607_1